MEKTDRQLMEEILADCKEIEKMLFAVRTSLNVLARNTTMGKGEPRIVTMPKAFVPRSSSTRPSDSVHYKEDDIG